ncbi:DUF6894 family protein [Sphingomonas crusticola]|uniref:DUF6894 family protein n=1 Tax=Sphingomonas crusticola TaxID=1697973 RepID=UPI000E22D325
MPQYYFDLHECGTVLEDDEGHELPGTDAARDMTVKFARSIMAAEVVEGRLCLGCHIVVRGENRDVLLQVPFRQAVHLAGI